MRSRRIRRSSFAGFFALIFVASSAAGRAQAIERVSVDSNGVEANNGSLWSTPSTDGRYVVFTSWASNLVAGDTNGRIDVFVRDRVAGTTERVSVDSSGAEGIPGDFAGSENGMAISADGRIVAFASDFVNLVGNDTNGTRDVFIHDRTTGVTERVSIDSSGAEADSRCDSASMSSDGRYVCFMSWATNLVSGDSNGFLDVFVHDRSTGITERVSVDSAGIEGNGGSLVPVISADGRFVTFESWASNLVAGDMNGDVDVFVHDRTTGVTERVSVDSSGAEADGGGDTPSMSADGRYVCFASWAANLVPGDSNGWGDIFVHDRSTGITERISVDSSGHEGDSYSDQSWASISGDGMRVAFFSEADNFVAGDTNATFDVFLRDRLAGTTTLISRNASRELGNAISDLASIAPDGKSISFSSSASNLVDDDTNNQADIFICVHDGKSRWTRYGAGWPGTNGIPSITPSADPTLGTTISITIDNSLGATTDALLVVGTQRTHVPSVWGGELLVDPFLVMAIVLDAVGFTMTGDVPNDPTLAGFVLDVQALELDGGASRGVSFTDGLELVLGD